MWNKINQPNNNNQIKLAVAVTKSQKKNFIIRQKSQKSITIRRHSYQPSRCLQPIVNSDNENKLNSVKTHLKPSIVI